MVMVSFGGFKKVEFPKNCNALSLSICYNACVSNVSKKFIVYLFILLFFLIVDLMKFLLIDSPNCRQEWLKIARFLFTSFLQI